MGKQKIRPCHLLGQLLQQTPSHRLTPLDIYEALKDVPLIRNNCQKAFGDPSIPDGPAKLYRLPIWVSNLVNENAWNGRHGGASIITEKMGRTVIGYTLTTPEMLNIFGQVMHTDTERLADKALREKIAADIGEETPKIRLWSHTDFEPPPAVTPTNPGGGTEEIQEQPVNDNGPKLMITSGEPEEDNVVTIESFESFVTVEEVETTDPVAEAFEEVTKETLPLTDETNDSGDMEYDTLELTNEAIKERNAKRKQKAA